MPDLLDLAQQIEAEHLARAIKAACAPVAEGEPGDCSACGDHSLRLVRGRCAFCRDGRRRPPPVLFGRAPEVNEEDV
ncbi:conjugal transfer protein TraR [Sphingomonas sp. BAUL-RG-20F-R05-02]|uniref:conjugal transfer protein TraR n=1 Tax=Sphingomonas sp. BAUL-RG-20F-R05-02 TaxID=2914830 RepID=UPI001F59BB7D|nr:conjugal transfer protein TraR [Sphingomonas sp. BAUL-RG-20F-R05-02]